MGWPKGRPRLPQMGRKKGTRNRRTVEIEELFARYNFNPILRMMKMCQEPDEVVPKELKAQLLKELAQYGWPKRKAIEHSGVVTVDSGVMDLSDPIAEEDMLLASGRNGSTTPR